MCPSFIIIELPQYITCLGLTLIAISLTLSFSLLQFLIVILKPQAISISLVSFRFALYYTSSFTYSYIIIKSLIQLGIYNIIVYILYYASSFTYSCVIIKLLIQLGTYNIAVYIKQKVTIKVGQLYIVASQYYTSITLVLDVVRGQLLERQKVG